jgi:tetratricopeptide (TPR) repeat protein
MDEQFQAYPVTSYARASVIYAELCDSEDTTGAAELQDHVNSCVNIGRDMLRHLPEDYHAELEYYMGAALSISGLTMNRTGERIRGIRRVMSSREHFDRCIELDPNFFDAYMGRGAYRYAAAQSMGMFSWLPFVPSKRQGWSDLTIAAEQSFFSRYAAMSAMVWILIDEERYAEANGMIEQGLARFPSARTFLLPKLSLEKKTGRWGAAFNTGQELLRQFESLPNQNGYEIVGLYRTLMDCSDHLNRPDEAVRFARAGLSVKLTPYAQERRTETLRTLQDRVSRAEGKP